MRRLLLSLLLLLAAAPALAQHGLGAREQWQPQIGDTDARLQQSVEIEILGRAAVPALAMLSQATGVSLTVAPENLPTVGERKLSIFAQGCTLKDIMVQTQEALQECHWDIDESSDPPVYLLHRNAGVEYTQKWLSEQRALAAAEEERPQREARVDQARRALRMSPEELAELEQSDLLLARSVQHPAARSAMEAFLSLGPEAMETFLSTGHLDLKFADAPERVQQEARKAAEPLDSPEFESFGGTAITPEKLKQAKESPDTWRIQYSYFATLETDDGCIFFTLLVPVAASYGPLQGVAVPPRRADEFPGGRLHGLLVETGTPEAEAEQILRQQADELGVEAQQGHARQRDREWVEPADPRLHVPVTLRVEEDDFLQFCDIQALIARQTGFSVIADYFIQWPKPLPESARGEMPLWCLLYLLGERWNYKWESAGHCLVFHHSEWYELAPGEVPESVLQTYCQRLEAEGKLTLDDFAGFAIALGDKPGRFNRLPRDLDATYSFAQSKWAFRFYATLSPHQAEQARAPEGLPLEAMTTPQRRVVHERAAHLDPPLPDDDAVGATFHVVEPPISERMGRRFHGYSLWLQFGERTDRAGVGYVLPETPH
jgi:hypothetical protein